MVVSSGTRGKTPLQDIKHDAAGRWPTILTEAGLPVEVQDGQHHPCPKCGGTDRFRVFPDFAETGGAYCNQCLTTKNGDGLAVLQWLLDCDFLTALSEISARLGTVCQTSLVRPPKANRDKQSWPTSRDAVAALETTRGPRSATWHYHNAAGCEVGIVLRWDQPDGGKDIMPLVLSSDGWRCGAMPEPRPLYRFPKLNQAEVVFVTEGEKSADAGVSIGLNCTTSSGGSNAAHKTDWSPLAGKDVVIIPDNDKPGLKYAETVARIVAKLDPPATVRILNLSKDWPELPDKGDLADWIDAHDAVESATLRERLKTLVNSADRCNTNDIGNPADLTISDTKSPEADDDFEEEFELQLLDSTTFASKNFRRHYLVKRVLVEGQSCLIGGPKKCMKTGTLVDLAVSLGTGTPFLSNPDFVVPERVRTCVLSGESGGFTLKETATRICVARNRLLSTADVLWGFDLPQLANPQHLRGIEKTIIERGIRVLIVDPAYLCLLSGSAAINPGDVFAMGQILKRLSELGDRTGCTIILAHHTRKKDRKERQTPTDLEDLSMSGFAEWARQWLLLGRRAEYRGDGKHDLWLSIGGSAGHSGCYVLSVDEGIVGDDLGGRHWDTRVESASDAIERSREAAEQRKSEAEGDRRLAKLDALAGIIRKHPAGETKSRLRSMVKPQPTAAEIDDLIDDLIQRKAAEPCDVVKNGTTYAGFRPRPLEE